VWSVLGVERLASPEELKRAFRRRALETHPDRGGDAAEFRAVHAAYEEALARRGTRGRR
jgi:curved DNA-binding protein CbpA